MPIKSVLIDDMESFHKKCAELDRNKRWIFRGQTNADWGLCTKLERALNKIPSNERLEGGSREAENNLLREFRRHFHRYSQDSPSAANRLEWLSIMQRHGAPTRLLDWTFSEYIALFFAVNDVEVDEHTRCSVWAVNQTECLAKVKYKLPPEEQALLENDDKDLVATNWMLEDGDELTLVAPLNPFRLNTRLAVQQGTFLVPLNMKVSFEDNFEEAVGRHPDLCLKLDIPCTRDFLVSAFTFLKRVNITDLSLFPDLDGLARSTILSVILRHLQRQKW